MTANKEGKDVKDKEGKDVKDKETQKSFVCTENKEAGKEEKQTLNHIKWETKQQKQEWWDRNIFFKLVAVVALIIVFVVVAKFFGLGSSGKNELLGGLEISVKSIDEDSYKMSTIVKEESEFGQTLSRKTIDIIYEMIDIEVFNPTTKNIVFKSIKLVDNLGNEYLPDSNPPDVTLQDFGRDMIVSPSTKRKGTLFFLQINEDADDFELIIELESGEKKVFKF